MATVVSDPTQSALDSEVAVSVAVFYKRAMSDGGAGEYVATVKRFPVFPMTSGGEAISRICPLDSNGKVKPLKPGQWIMLAGCDRDDACLQLLPLVSRVVGLELRHHGNAEQHVTLAGQDWPIPTTRIRRCGSSTTSSTCMRRMCGWKLIDGEWWVIGG